MISGAFDDPNLWIRLKRIEAECNEAVRKREAKQAVDDYVDSIVAEAKAAASEIPKAMP